MPKLIFHCLYWSLIFFTGVFQIMGIDSGIYKLGVPFVGGTLFLYTVLGKGDQMKYPFLSWFMAFIGVAVTSSIINHIDKFSLLYFLIYTTLSYFYFVVLVNEDNFLLISKLVLYVKVLFIIQIPAIIIKFLVLGQSEKGGIGTLSINAGSVSTIFPVFVIAILICHYLFTERIKYLFLIACFCLFAIIGEKRAIIFFIPVVFVLSYFLFYKMTRMIFVKRVVQKLILVIIGGVVAFYIAVRTNETLNPEHEVGGSFNTEYLASYVINYTSSDDKSQEEMRRKDGLLYFTNYVFSGSPQLFFLGDGAGKLIQSKYNDQAGTMMDTYGVRYGGRMGFVWLLLQVGTLGTFLYLMFFLRLFRFVHMSYLSHPIYLSFMVLTIVFFMDMFFYSNVFLRYEYLKGVYFLMFAMIYLDQKYQTAYFTNLIKV